MDVTKQKSLTVTKIKAFVKLIIDKAKSDKLWQVTFVLSQNLIALFFTSNCKVIQCGSYQDSALSDLIFILTHTLIVSNEKFTLTHFLKVLLDGCT